MIRFISFFSVMSFISLQSMAYDHSRVCKAQKRLMDEYDTCVKDSYFGGIGCLVRYNFRCAILEKANVEQAERIGLNLVRQCGLEYYATEHLNRPELLKRTAGEL